MVVFLSRVFIILFLAVVLFPALEIFLNSFEPGETFSSLVPQSLTLSHYGDLFAQTPYLLWVRNSVIVCTSTAVLSVALVASMAYAFSRFRFRGRRYGLMVLLLIQMFPAQMSLVALYYLLLQVHLLDTLQGLILVFLGGGLPFGAWLFKGYIDSLPIDIEEAAHIDGATKLQVFLRVVLPLTRPMMAVIFLFTWFGIYSEFFLTSYLIQSRDHVTVALGLYGFIENQFFTNWTEFAAAATISSLPVMVAFLLAQRLLIAGLTRGAVEG